MKNLKLQLGEEVRLIRKIPDHINAVKEKASAMFGIENPCFQYKDEDGDIITIDTQEEYEDTCTAHSGPLKLSVIDSKFIQLKRSSVFNGLMNEENHSFKCDSFNDSSKLSIILPSESDIKVQEHSIMIQTDQISFLDKETMMLTLEDKDCEANLTNDVSTFCENPIDQYKLLQSLIQKYLGTSSKEGITYKGVKCIKCSSKIYDVLYRCNSCKFFYLCENCEVTDNHQHPLIKSRNKVEQGSSKVSESMDSIKQLKIVETLGYESMNKKENRENLSDKIEQLKIWGFHDKNKCIDALIKCDYVLEKALDYLIENDKKNKTS